MPWINMPLIHAALPSCEHSHAQVCIASSFDRNGPFPNLPLRKDTCLCGAADNNMRAPRRDALCKGLSRAPSACRSSRRAEPLFLHLPFLRAQLLHTHG
eukprot:359517-Chlamydomonas_euryale.AAC.4